MCENKIEIDNTKMGLSYSKEKSTFRVFAKGNDKVTLALYDKYNSVRRKDFPMNKLENDIFELTLDGDLDGKFYTYIANESEVTDPYSYGVSANSQRSAIFDLSKTDPEGFRESSIPDNKWNEAILYEVHIADFTADKSAGSTYPGKFLGFAQAGTSLQDISTGLDHLEELGITHVHLLPVYDYITVDETKDITEDGTNYNWGYDPELYNCVEGSYATDPYNPKTRIYEYKKLIQEIHKRGMSVVMDVVYNHTFKTKDSNFNVLAPGYYHRNVDGNFSEGSGCGNEFWSESKMGRKFIVDSLMFWAKEYKIDGFRFDLMALIDMDTIEYVTKALREINPNIIIYGEPWMAQGCLLDPDQQVLIGSQKGKDFAIFNPFIRDALRGDNDGIIPGYLQGDFRYKYDIEKGIMGSVSFDGTISNFRNPTESINYFNAHDNLIFQDKLVMTDIKDSLQNKLTVMAFSYLLMSQGIPFFHAGNEFLRDKKLDHNSYSSPISVNGIDWNLKVKNIETNNTIRDLIKFRKESGLFYLKTKEEVLEHVSLVKGLKDSLIGYLIRRDNNTFFILHNASNKGEKIKSKLSNNAKLIWENGFINKHVKEFKIEPYTSNVYEIKGEIYEL